VGWKFWNRQANGSLSDKVKKTLFVQFALGTDEVELLRAVLKSGRLDGKKVRYIRIYDPTPVEADSQPIRRYEDLDSQEHRIRFQGHIEKYGPVHLEKVEVSHVPSGHQELTGRFRDAVAARFNLDSSEVAVLRYVEKEGMLAVRAVRYVRIFDPAFFEGSENVAQSYDDLDNYQGAVLFQGYFEPNGMVYLSDRRRQSAA